MRSNDRFLAALHHQPVDRLPRTYEANAGIDARLKTHFGLSAHDDEGVQRCLGIDLRAGWPGYTGPSLHHADPAHPDWQVDSDWGIQRRWAQHASGGYWDFCGFPLRDADEAQAAAWPLPDPDRYDYAGFAGWCQAQGDHAVALGNAGVIDLLNGTGMLRGVERTMLDLGEGAGAGLVLMARRAQHHLAVLARTLEACRGLIDVVWLGEDLGSQRGPLISMATWRRHLRPWHAQAITCARSFGIPVMMHSCGASSWVYDDLIGLGVTAVDTLQPEAAGMDAATLKARFGGRLAFHGGISTGGVLAHGRPDEVRAEVRRVAEILGAGGGYCLAPTHMIQDDTPVENVLAMYAAA